jgi:hypothetical protein
MRRRCGGPGGVRESLLTREPVPAVANVYDDTQEILRDTKSMPPGRRFRHRIPGMPCRIVPDCNKTGR